MFPEYLFKYTNIYCYKINIVILLTIKHFPADLIDLHNLHGFYDRYRIIITFEINFQ
jgi:hypothetical protein